MSVEAVPGDRLQGTSQEYDFWAAGMFSTMAVGESTQLVLGPWQRTSETVTSVVGCVSGSQVTVKDSPCVTGEEREGERRGPQLAVVGGV